MRLKSTYQGGGWDVVVREGATILKLPSCEDEALLVRREAPPVLDLGLDIVDSV
jgi:hypothetical protein